MIFDSGCQRRFEIIDEDVKPGTLASIMKDAGSNPYGVKVCDCKSKGIHQCDYSRKYADPDASWGWDRFYT